MKISYNWLKDYINTDLSPKHMAEYLTNIGLEVEGLNKYSPVKGGLEGVVVGEVKSCEQHPNADKLFRTRVDIGSGEEVPVICGAPNVKTGQKVPVATVGTTVYKGEESLTIKETKIRGETSKGMICAEDEIGMGNSHEGIMELDSNAQPGTPAKDYFNLPEDTTIEIDLTPNRIDSGSHYGVARDLAAALQKDHYAVARALPSVESFTVDKAGTPTTIHIEEPEACPRYAGVNLTGVKVEESPEWLQNRLKAIGLTPVNNIVDITNYVLHETGQPLHAFDHSKIKGNTIIVRFLPENTVFTTLDDVERKLSGEDLMICNAEEGMALAGVFGGRDSGVTHETTDIFIESAYFNPVYIRRTAKNHSLSTDASFRFERGADPEMTIYALKRAALLMKDIAGGQISSDINDVYPNPVQPAQVTLYWKHTQKLIGQHIDHHIIKNILQSLDIQILEEHDEYLWLQIPPYRVDVTREADVVEEILRIYGYDQIEVPHKLNATLSYSDKTDDENLKHTIKHLLTGNGFHEIMVNSLTRAAYYEESQSFPQDQTVTLYNPLSSDLNALRQTLLFGGLETIAYNINRKNPDLKLFEFGNCYKQANQPPAGDPLSAYVENQHASMFLTGNHYKPNWIKNAEPVSFFHIKAYTELVLRRLGLSQSGQIKEEEHESDIFGEGLMYYYNNQPVAETGKIRQHLLKKMDISSDVYYTDFYWDVLAELVRDRQILYKELPKYPEVRRDLALLIDQHVRYKEIQELAYQTENNLLKQVSLFDVYEGDQIEENKKSYAVSFTFQHTHRTLTDEEVDQIMEQLIRTFEKKLKARLR